MEFDIRLLPGSSADHDPEHPLTITLTAERDADHRALLCLAMAAKNNDAHVLGKVFSKLVHDVVAKFRALEDTAE